MVVLDGIGEDFGLTLNIRRVTDRIGIGPDRELDDPQTHPTQWMMIVIAMAIVENGTTNLDYLSKLKGWEMAMEL